MYSQIHQTFTDILIRFTDILIRFTDILQIFHHSIILQIFSNLQIILIHSLGIIQDFLKISQILTDHSHIYLQTFSLHISQIILRSFSILPRHSRHSRSLSNILTYSHHPLLTNSSPIPHQFLSHSSIFLQVLLQLLLNLSFSRFSPVITQILSTLPLAFSSYYSDPLYTSSGFLQLLLRSSLHFLWLSQISDKHISPSSDTLHAFSLHIFQISQKILQILSTLPILPTLPSLIPLPFLNPSQTLS